MEIKKKISIIVLAIVIIFSGCVSNSPEAIVLNKDVCEHCKMPIADLKFSSELITQKGRVYKFDDIVCIVDYIKNTNQDSYSLYFSNFAQPDKLLSQEQVQLVKNTTLNGPMNGQIVAFESLEQANATISNGDNEAVAIDELLK